MFGDIKSLKKILIIHQHNSQLCLLVKVRAFPTKENSCAALRKNTYQ